MNTLFPQIWMHKDQQLLTLSRYTMLFRNDIISSIYSVLQTSVTTNSQFYLPVLLSSLYFLAGRSLWTTAPQIVLLPAHFHGGYSIVTLTLSWRLHITSSIPSDQKRLRVNLQQATAAPDRGWWIDDSPRSRSSRYRYFIWDVSLIPQRPYLSFRLTVSYHQD